MSQTGEQMDTAAVFDRYVMPNYGRFPISFVRGQGSRIEDESGRSYLDFAAGIATCTLGHSSPVIAGALTEQAGKLVHCSNLYRIPLQGELARFIVERVMERPGKVFFCNSGAEANDSLIKLARKFGHDLPAADGSTRFEVITCEQSFHGRTLGGIAATGQDKVKQGFDPMLPGFAHVPLNDVAVLRKAITPQTAAILFEPLQGEGGIRRASPEFIAAAADLCREHKLLLMFDEVQCGLGRTGSPRAWESVLEGSGVSVEPDAVSWAKGLGGGFPVGAIWASDRVIDEGREEKLCDVLGPGTHGSTFGGTPLGAAVTLAVQQAVAHGRLWENASRQEQRIRDAIESWHAPLVKELRGLGLMLGFLLDGEVIKQSEEFCHSAQTPSVFVVSRAMEAGLLTVPAGPDVVRWLPALNVTDEEVDEALAILKGVLDDLS
jgi:acetylornithine/succinyldiaminopimelate/putrescine aminotransferase